METVIAITGVGFGGAGVGRLPDGRACFVHGTLPGERAIVRISRSKKSFAEADLVRLLEVSPGRKPADCPAYGVCGGCTYQHANYQLQLEIKTGQVRDLLRRIGGFSEPAVQPMLPSPNVLGYRTRLAVHIDDGKLGFHARKSRHIVEVSHCPLASPAVNDQLAHLAKNPPARPGRLTIRENPDSTRGFSQVNPGAAAALLETVSSRLTGRHVLVDAYCGSGFFAKALRDRFERVIGIEWSAGAVAAAAASALPHESYLSGSVENHLHPALASASPDPVTLILDPPAEGLSPDVVATIHALPPSELAYVSCDPATLARDLKKLSSSFTLTAVQPVDMFPQTAEIESVAFLVAK